MLSQHCTDRQRGLRRSTRSRIVIAKGLRTLMIRLRAPVALSGLLATSACAPPAAEHSPQPREHAFCALNGAEQFSGDCTVERSRAGEAIILVVRHPDGGFRRFTLGRDGNGLVTADGADQAGVAANGTLLDVRVGRDRYRFPLEEPVPDATAR